jgi:hypothetical protein
MDRREFLKASSRTIALSSLVQYKSALADQKRRRERVLLSRMLARPRISVIFAILLGAWLLFNGVRTAQHIFGFYTPLPIRDYWAIVAHLPHYQSFHLGVLWEQHNEHRIVFPEIIFAADMLLAHGRMLLPLLLSAISYIATWVILSSAVVFDFHVLRNAHNGHGLDAPPKDLASSSLSGGARSVPCALPKVDRAIAALLSGVLAFFETTAMVLAVPFLLQWTLMQFAVVSSLLFVSCLKHRQSEFYLWSAIGAATLASFSSVCGLLLWPLVILIASLLGLAGRRLIILTSAAVLNFTVFFIGYRFPAKLALWRLVAHPIYTLQFLASYVSMPFGAVKDPVFGISVGCVNILLAVI